MSLVSVIVPAHNAEEYLAGAINSALAQTHADLEVLVVDDGSSDGTAALARGFGGRVRCVSQKNAGPSAARNTGLAEARGEYVSFLDADDELRPTRIEALLAALKQASPRAAFSMSDAMMWDGTRFYWPLEISRPVPGERDMNAFLDDSRPATWILARRQTLLDCGAFRADLWRNEDYHLWLRLLSGGRTYTYVPEPLYVYRYRPDSLSRARVEQFTAACQVHQEALRTMPFTMEQRRRLVYMLWRDRARLQFIHARTARSEGRSGAWAMRTAAGAACQAVRLAIRPHYSISRGVRHMAGRAQRCSE